MIILFYFCYNLFLEYEAMKSLTSEETETTATGDVYSTVAGATQDPLYANVEKGKADGGTAAAPTFDPLIPKTCPVSISDLGTHVASYHSETDTQFHLQYQVTTVYIVVTIVIQHLG